MGNTITFTEWLAAGDETEETHTQICENCAAKKDKRFRKIEGFWYTFDRYCHKCFRANELIIMGRGSRSLERMAKDSIILIKDAFMDYASGKITAVQLRDKIGATNEEITKDIIHVEYGLSVNKGKDKKAYEKFLDELEKELKKCTNQ